MLPEKKYCKECAEELHGRKDKMYCSDYCRAAYYNHLYTDKYAHIRKINGIIRHNWNILVNLNQHEHTILFDEQLTEAGFSFDYYTHIQKVEDKTIYFCYDQGYTKLESGKYLLIAGNKEVMIKQKRQTRVFLLNRYQPA